MDSPGFNSTSKNDLAAFSVLGMRGNPQAVVVTPSPPIRTISVPAFNNETRCDCESGGTRSVAAVPTVIRVE
jgi:hypothetical protein